MIAQDISLDSKRPRTRTQTISSDRKEQEEGPVLLRILLRSGGREHVHAHDNQGDDGWYCLVAGGRRAGQSGTKDTCVGRLSQIRQVVLVVMNITS